MQILHPIYTQDRERIAVRAGQMLVTYEQLCADIDTMAHWLFGAGLEPADQSHAASKSHCQHHLLGLDHATWRNPGPGRSTPPWGMPPAVAATGEVWPYVAAIGKIETLEPGIGPQHKLNRPLLHLPCHIPIPNAGTAPSGSQRVAQARPARGRACVRRSYVPV